MHDQTYLVDLNPDEYDQGLRYYPFMVHLDRCNGSYNILNDPSGRIYIPNKTGEVNLWFLNMIARINGFKALINYMSQEYKCKLDFRKCKSHQKWNNNRN